MTNSHLKYPIITALLFNYFAVNAQGFKLSDKKIEIYTTAKNTNQRISKSTDKVTVKKFPQPKETDIAIFIDPKRKFQKFEGIGGAITDASAEVLAKLPKKSQQEIIKAYYNEKEGIGYSLIRTTINSCDFSSDSYTYVKENDKELKSFDIAHDLNYKIPMIKMAKAEMKDAYRLYASPWSPPAWMKTNNSMLKGGSLKPEYYQTWANYFVKFIENYEKIGLPVWGVSIQNEPMATQTWESCIYTAEEERDFLKNNLGPTLHQKGMKDKKIIVWDHNRDLIYQRASTILNDAEAAKYVWGVGFHWYETWNGSVNLFNNVALTHEAFPNVNLIFTEGCKEQFDYNQMGNWSLGEKYGYNMINDFNSGTVAWTDWNVLLDERGGPNHVGNFCFAPIHGDTRNGQITYTNSFYYIGQFSKFIRPGAQRIAASSNRSDLMTTSFVNKDGKVVVVVMNQTDKPYSYNLWIEGEAVEVNSQEHSISTIVIS
ncbi:glycoside hydrolase family 30 protein [Empedobacter brevis]|uniref:glycoside hydrolase family 30 protein n=1 Tax=Empedobacter brevis TaxID=247 RepID=UPI0013202D5A|nr:glycoside hydrolase family 30 protein [Empedobacter brevis]QHC85738.1 glycosyl hydrolase [Empedobacter brevis]